MILHVEEVHYVRDFVVWLRFNDGAAGEVDLKDELFGEVFEPLKDLAAFRQFRLDPELNTITWNNGADLPPEYLHERLSVLAH